MARTLVLTNHKGGVAFSIFSMYLVLLIHLIRLCS
jgi:hypothetical protein